METTYQFSKLRQVSIDTYEYLLIIQPSEIVNEKINVVKRQFNETYKHKQAVWSQPHITLFNMHLDDFFGEILFDEIREAASLQLPFEVQLQNFNHFGAHTIFIDIKNAQPIVNLVKSLNKKINIPHDWTFFAWRPHLTIARRLEEKKFKAAIAVYKEKEFDASFFVDKIILLKRQGQFDKYKMVQEFVLGQ